jgi:hypothetical protein
LPKCTFLLGRACGKILTRLLDSIITLN